MNENNWNEEELWNQSSYQTGSTQPPKKRGGLLAVLLAAVIFLTGISSALGLLNIRLTNQLRENEDGYHPVSFYQADTITENGVTDGGSPVAALGIEGETVTEVYQRYYGLPAGVCVTKIISGGAAGEAGLAVGDIVLSIGGARVTAVDELTDILCAYKDGDTVQLEVYRGHQQKTVAVTLGQAGE